MFPSAKCPHLCGLPRAGLAAQQDDIVLGHGLHNLLLHADDGQPAPGLIDGSRASHMHKPRWASQRHSPARLLHTHILT